MAKTKNSDPRASGLAESGHQPFAQTAADQAIERRAQRVSPGNPPGGVASPAAPAHEVVPTDARGFQQYLVTKGAKIAVDGVIGPKTLAAAQQLGVAVPDNLNPSVAPPVDTSPADSTPGPTPDVAPASTTSIPTANMDDASLAQNFGYGTWVLQVPELKAILDQYAQSQQSGTPMTGDQLRTAVEGSNYFRTTSQTQRDFTKLQTEDPTSAQAKVDAQTSYIQSVAQPLGITIDPGRAAQMAQDSIRFGWNPSQVEQAVSSEWHYKPGGQTGKIGQQELGIKQLAGDYLVPVADSTLQQWDQQIAQSNGRLTSEDFRTYLAEQAKTLYPTMAAQIDKGLTTNQLVDPYRQIAAKELNVAPDSIDFTDPKWMVALNAPTDPKTGERQMMGLADWTQKIRSDDSYGWDSTVNGKTAYTQAAVALTQALGLRS